MNKPKQETLLAIFAGTLVGLIAITPIWLGIKHLEWSIEKKYEIKCARAQGIIVQTPNGLACVKDDTPIWK